MVGVLDGVRVIDLSWGTAGPMTTMMLADMGADVVRVERPDGDPFADQAGYRVWNRGKRSAVIDLPIGGRRRRVPIARRRGPTSSCRRSRRAPPSASASTTPR